MWMRGLVSRAEVECEMGGSGDTAIPPSNHADSVKQEVKGQSVVADYTESVVPRHARRSNFRMVLTFGSMQLVVGAGLVGYGARFEGLSLGRLVVAMTIAAVTKTAYCIGSANVGAAVREKHAVATRARFGTV